MRKKKNTPSFYVPFWKQKLKDKHCFFCEKSISYCIECCGVGRLLYDIRESEDKALSKIREHKDIYEKYRYRWRK